jgi:hypothetical protein
MAVIQAPNKGYNGISAGVKFVNGEAECDDEFLIRWFRTHGYGVKDNSRDDKGAVVRTASAETDAEENGEDKPGTSDAEKAAVDGSKGAAEEKPTRRKIKRSSKSEV